MSFDITDGDGQKIREVYSCTECRYVSTKRHFRDGQPPECPHCGANAEESRTITESTGMPSYQYNEILSWLQENTSGIGEKTVNNIKDEFPEGEGFVEQCKAAFEQDEYDSLTEVNGVGESSAEKLAEGLAEKRGWERSQFNISE